MDAPSADPRSAVRRDCRVLVALTAGERRALEAVARVGCRSLSSVVRDALLAGLPGLRDRYAVERDRAAGLLDALADSPPSLRPPTGRPAG